jgi:hypothetical protein
MTHSLRRTRTVHLMSTLALLTALGACGGGGSGGGGDPGGGGGGGGSLLTIGGSISNLSAAGLVLHNNGGDALTLPAGATTFTFATRLASGAGYAVTVANQPGSGTPDAQVCTVSRGSGMATANVTNIAIDCGAVAPLALASTDPVDEATGVPRRTRPAFTFSAPLLPVSDPAVALGEPLLTTDLPTLSQSGATLTIGFSNRLLPLTRYEFGLDGSFLVGAGGERPAGPGWELRFTTADNSWRDAETVPPTESKGTVAGTAAAMDARGNLFVSWTANSRLWVARHDAALGAWGAVAELAAPNLEMIRLGTDAAGNAVAVWNEYRGLQAGSSLMATRYSVASGQWETPVPLTDGGDTSLHERPSLSVAPTGQVVLAWRRLVPGVGYSAWMRLASTASGEAWGASQRLDDDATNPTLEGRSQMGPPVASIAFTTSDEARVAVAWAHALNQGGDAMRIYLRRFSNGRAATSTPEMVSTVQPATASAVDPDVLVDVAGRTLVAWRRVEPSGTGNPTVSQVQMRIRDGQWNSMFDVSGNGNFALRPRIATGGGREVVMTAPQRTWVSWIESGPAARAMVARVASSQPWVTDHQVLDGALGAVGADPRVDLAVDLVGNALATWAGGPGAAPTSLLAARFNPGTGQWSQSVTVAEGQDFANAESRRVLASSPWGDMALVWMHRSPTDANVFPLRVRRFD